MFIEKSTGDVHIPVQIKKCDSFYCRLKGLMFRTKPLKDSGLWLIPCNSIHMFFMFFPIDVVFLDREMNVVMTYQNVRPWRFIPPVPNAYSTLELPYGTIGKYKIQPGQKLIV